MTQLLAHKIDKFTQITDTLAVSGQPAGSQFKLIKEAGYQLVLRVKIDEIDASIPDEEEIVFEQGMLYEEVQISFKNPTQVAFEKFSDILNTYQNLNIYVHCTAGYCTSGLLIPYLMRYKNYTKSVVTEAMIVKDFSASWNIFIDEMANPSSDAQYV